MKSETFKELKQLLLANGIKKLCQENELNEFIGILILNEALPEQAAEELVNEEIQSDLIELFIEKLFQSFPQIYTSSLKKEITNRMARIHFNAIFSGKVLLFENIFDLSYFQENYQVVFDFCRSFIATQKKAKEPICSRACSLFILSLFINARELFVTGNASECHQYHD
ncbi:MAG: hypothetical protein ACLT90_16915 [Enterococcus raffinosus]